MSLRLAIIDAANNCAKHGATATVTLKSGVQISGTLNRNLGPDDVHIRKSDGGWASVDFDEVAAVEVSP